MNEKVYLKVAELKPCYSCGGPIFPLFKSIRIRTFVIKPQAVNEYLGMHQFFGGRSSVLTELFSPHSDEAAEMLEEEEILVCQSCALIAIEQMKSGQTKLAREGG